MAHPIIIKRFTADQPGVLRGTPVTLRWDVSGSATIAIAAFPGGNLSVSSTTLTGSTTYPVTAKAVTFRLTATGVAGSVSADVTVEGLDPGLRIAAGVSTVISPHTIRYNGQSVVAVDYQYQGTGTHVRRIRLRDSATDPAATILWDSGPFTEDSKSYVLAVQRTSSLQIGTWVDYFVENIDGGFTLPNVNNGGGFLSVGPPEAPRVTFFASPDKVASGGTSVLRWTVDGASGVSLDQGIGAVQSNGALLCAPSGTATYTLTATGPGGTTVSTVTVTVVPPPTINAFTATPSSLNGPGQSVLSWNVTGADTVVLDQGLGQVAPVSGSVTIPINSPGLRVFTITASNFAGTTTATAQLQVTYPPELQITTASPLPPTDTAVPLSLTFQATGGYGNGSYVWSIPADQLPPGTSLTASTGVLSGQIRASQTTTFSFLVTVQSGAFSATKLFTIDVAYVPPLEILTPAILPRANQLFPYTLQLDAAGGYGPGTYRWRFTTTAAPELNLVPSTGLLTGDFTHLKATRTYTISVTAASRSVETTKVFTLVVEYLTVKIVTDHLPVLTINEAGSATLEAIYGNGTNAWSILSDNAVPASGALPAGLSLNASTGVISGVPTVAGYYPITVKVISDGYSDVRKYELVVGLSGCKDPYRKLFYRVLDDTGTPIPGLTNDNCPNGAKTIIGRVAVGLTVGTSEIEIQDLRQQGGGLAPEFQGIPEAQHFWDLGYLDGKPYPLHGALAVYLPASILIPEGSFTKEDVAKRLAQIVPMGVLPVVRYYNEFGEEV